MSYETRPHGGAGIKQKKLHKSAGEGRYSTTPNAERVPHRMQKHSGGCYDTSAHTDTHHGPNGQAVGVKGSTRPMKYHTRLQGEGAPRLPAGGPAFVESYRHGTTNKAHHHPPMSPKPHEFNQHPAKESHGYGHPAHLRRGHLRLSGHSKADHLGQKPYKHANARSPKYSFPH